MSDFYFRNRHIFENGDDVPYGSSIENMDKLLDLYSKPLNYSFMSQRNPIPQKKSYLNVPRQRQRYQNNSYTSRRNSQNNQITSLTKFNPQYRHYEEFDKQFDNVDNNQQTHSYSLRNTRKKPSVKTFGQRLSVSNNNFESGTGMMSNIMNLNNLKWDDGFSNTKKQKHMKLLDMRRARQEKDRKQTYRRATNTILSGIGSYRKKRLNIERDVTEKQTERFNRYLNEQDRFANKVKKRVAHDNISDLFSHQQNPTTTFNVAKDLQKPQGQKVNYDMENEDDLANDLQYTAKYKRLDNNQNRQHQGYVQRKTNKTLKRPTILNMDEIRQDNQNQQQIYQNIRQEERPLETTPNNQQQMRDLDNIRREYISHKYQIGTSGRSNVIKQQAKLFDSIGLRTKLENQTGPTWLFYKKCLSKRILAAKKVRKRREAIIQLYSLEGIETNSKAKLR